ncbi:hypothetical protein HanIR_Chr06g0265971 [Helianthus annuus]|nr:hypothetical protein HanIR_Chr06g0265971 [Helianthus annuus]
MSSDVTTPPLCCNRTPVLPQIIVDNNLLSPLICKAVITDFNARPGEPRFEIINSLISAGLIVAPVLKISSTCGNSL